MDGRGSRWGLNWGCERLKPPRVTGIGAGEQPQLWGHPNSEPLATEGEGSRAIVVSDVKDSDHRISPKCSVGLLP